jgi:hypothetical protein
MRIPVILHTASGWKSKKYSDKSLHHIQLKIAGKVMGYFDSKHIQSRNYHIMIFMNFLKIDLDL